MSGTVYRPRWKATSACLREVALHVGGVCSERLRTEIMQILQQHYRRVGFNPELGDGFNGDDESERAAIDAMPNIETQLKDELAVHTPEGSGTRIEELVTLPAFNARGITGGGVGDQGRNIILSSSTVSLNLRLVPNQRPERIRQIIENHITKEGYSIIYEDPTDDILRANPKVVKLDWRGGGSPGLRTSMDGPMAQRLINVMRELTPELILTPTMGGGLPLNAFASRIETPIIVLPLANHDNNQHGENENLRLQNLWDAIMVYGVVLTQLGRD